MKGECKMTREAYELLMEILDQRREEHHDNGDYDTAWTYGNVQEMIRLAQQDKLDCLGQYGH